MKVILLVSVLLVVHVESISIESFYIEEPKVTDDLRFVVPLLTGQRLCYNMRGLDSFAFNLISHPIISINALLAIPNNESSLIKDATVMTDIGILVQPDHCRDKCRPKDITKMIVSSSDRSIILYGSKTVITNRPVFVLIENSTAIIHLGQALPNKRTPSLIVSVKKPKISLKIYFDNEHLNMIITDDTGLGSDCHGIIGQFIHREAHIQNKLMTINENVVEIENKPMWDIDIPCIHAKPHYGDQAEGVLEGDITDYVVENIFSPEFSYSKFKM